MNLIPVIDLMQGQVVRAVRGERAAYRPIESRLCASSDPVTVARILCDHCATRRLYVADLDALLGRPAQTAVLRSLRAALPDVELWLDAGFRDVGEAESLRDSLHDPLRDSLHGPLRDSLHGPLRDPLRIATAGVVPVFGSESLASRKALERCFAGAVGAADAGSRPTDAVLSLDRRDGRRLDAAGCWDAAELWPKRVIVMTLERVGSQAGPDLQTLADVRLIAPGAFVVGAGGIRDHADLERARRAGAAAWLVASALHDGRLARVQG